MNTHWGHIPLINMAKYLKSKGAHDLIDFLEYLCDCGQFNADSDVHIKHMMNPLMRIKWFAVVVDDIPFEIHTPRVYKVVEELVSRLGLTFTDTARGVKTSTSTVMKHLLDELPSTANKRLSKLNLLMA